jgi:hypothetical protein
MWLPEVGGGEMGSDCFMGTGFPLGLMKRNVELDEGGGCTTLSVY